MVQHSPQILASEEKVTTTTISYSKKSIISALSVPRQCMDDYHLVSRGQQVAR